MEAVRSSDFERKRKLRKFASASSFKFLLNRTELARILTAYRRAKSKGNLQKLKEEMGLLYCLLFDCQSIQRNMGDFFGPFQTVFRIKQSCGDLVERRVEKKFWVKRVVKSLNFKSCFSSLITNYIPWPCYWWSMIVWYTGTDITILIISTQ